MSGELEVFTVWALACVFLLAIVGVTHQAMDAIQRRRRKRQRLADIAAERKACERFYHLHGMSGDSRESALGRRGEISPVLHFSRSFRKGQ